MHLNGPLCESCELKLVDCHPDIQSFFVFVKANHPDCHISVGFRNEHDQAVAVLQGKSRTPWPTSKHNHTENEVACSLAIDIFRLDDKGEAQFESSYFEQIWKETQNANLDMRWGGSFIHLRDYDHFEVLSV